MTLFEFLARNAGYPSTSIVRRIIVTAPITLNGKPVEAPFELELTDGDEIDVDGHKYTYAEA